MEWIHILKIRLIRVQEFNFEKKQDKINLPIPDGYIQANDIPAQHWSKLQRKTEKDFIKE